MHSCSLSQRSTRPAQHVLTKHQPFPSSSRNPPMRVLPTGPGLCTDSHNQIDINSANLGPDMTSCLFFFFLIILFIFYFAGSLLLCRLFSACGERGFAIRTSHCHGFSCCGVWEYGLWGKWTSVVVVPKL